MGVSHSWGEVATKFGRLGVAYGDLPAVVVPDAALLTKKTVTALAPDRLRGVGKRGAKLSVHYNTTNNAAGAQALVFARGPWQLIERNTKAHRIPKERGSRARTRYVVIPNADDNAPHGPRGVRAFAQHPGTQGKHPWERGVTAARPGIARLFGAQGAAALTRIF